MEQENTKKASLQPEQLSVWLREYFPRLAALPQEVHSALVEPLLRVQENPYDAQSLANLRTDTGEDSVLRTQDYVCRVGGVSSQGQCAGPT